LYKLRFEYVWDPFHAGALLSQLNEQWLAGPAPFCDVTLVAADEAKFFAHQSILAACSPHFRQLLSSSTLALLKKDRVLELPHLQSRVLSNLLDYIYTSRVSTVCSTGTTWLCEAGRSLGVPFLAGLKVEESNHMKSKSGQDRIEGMEETDKAGAAKSAKTPLCFPLGMVFPSLAATEKHCPSSLSPRSPACLMGSEEPPWKMATSIGNQLHHLQNKPVTSLSPSSSSPIDLTAPARKDSLSSPTSATVSSASQFQNLPLGRALSCRHCGKAFIHNKRLQSHEAACRQAPHILPVQTKQEPLEEGDDEGERVGAMEDQPEQGHALPGRPPKKGRGFLRQHSRGFPQADLLGEEDHFVKVVDGHIIYFCAVCERSYMTLSSLKRHSNVHSWRRKYPCRYCDKVFALAEYRTKHEVWHTGERRYQCIFCWEAFATYYNLKTHQKALHGISPGLISSEKTANGGYKQKVNALKLYRLLPMRSQKRPYKTYSQSLADSLMLPPDPTVPLPLPLDCSLTSALEETVGEEKARPQKGR
uniref:Zinc finger and BTB domain containing 4 n=1 Tax=Scleropages formosus TaxID=113540 RepID=A0A8D0CMF9_SCLFO